jgi:predicted phosphoribosyltransferase
MMFRDRTQAGMMLAELLREHYDESDKPVVLAVPRGGVPVAAAVAGTLQLQLDVLLGTGILEPEDEKLIRSAVSEIDFKDRVVILADDGMCLGRTMQKAVNEARDRGARRIIVAVPLGTQEAVDEVTPVSHEVICMHLMPYITRVGKYYWSHPFYSLSELAGCIERHRKVWLKREAAAGDAAAEAAEAPRVR